MGVHPARHGMAIALCTALTNAVARVEADQATVDPTGVSPNVELLVSRSIATKRLRTAAEALTEVLDHDDDRDTVLSALSRAFYNYVDDPMPNSFAQNIAALRRNVPISTAALGLSGPSALVRPSRGYGGPNSRRVKSRTLWRMPAWYVSPAPRILLPVPTRRLRNAGPGGASAPAASRRFCPRRLATPARHPKTDRHHRLRSDSIRRTACLRRRPVRFTPPLPRWVAVYVVPR